MPKTKLAIFDIDGTLTKTNEIDHICYIETVQQFIDSNYSSFDAESFTHFTDSSILVELFEKYQNRRPSLQEELAFKEYYFKALKKSLETSPAYFQAIEGAREILHSLSDEWAVALATGCWMEAAQIKLQGGGVDIKMHSLATASDAVTRQDIMLTAVERAKKAHQVDAFERVVYIGDGIWDKKSCASLEIPFIGMDADNHNYGSGKLADFHLLGDYKDLERVIYLFERAEIPK